MIRHTPLTGITAASGIDAAERDDNRSRDGRLIPARVLQRNDVYAGSCYKIRVDAPPTPMRTKIIACALLVLFVTAFSIALVGCTKTTDGSAALKANSDASNDIAAAEAGIESAQGQGKAVKPHADDTGKAILDSQGETLTQARAHARSATTQLSSAQGDIIKLKQMNTELKASYADIYDSVGYTIERWVKRFFMWLCIFWAVWFAAGIGALFIPGGFGFGLSSLVRLTSILVPLGSWFTTLFDNLHFRGKTPSGKAAGLGDVLPSPVGVAAAVIGKVL